MFNNREIATAIWLVVVAACVLSKPDIRTSFMGVVRSFLAWKITVSFVAMALYTTTMVLGLYRLGFWQPAMFKDTVVWFLFTATAMVVRCILSQGSGCSLRNVLIDNVKIIIIIEFIADTYVMPLPMELLLLPVMTILTMMQVVAQRDETYASVARFLAVVLCALWFAVFGFAVWQAVGDYRNLGTVNTIRTVVFPPLMSALILPCIYVLLCLSTYELVTMRLSLGPKKSPALIGYAKRRIFCRCGLSHRRLQFLMNRQREITQIGSREDVDRLLTFSAL